MGLRFLPRTQIHPIEYETKQISRDKTPLCGPDSDETNDDAIDAGQDPTFPAAFADHDGRNDG